MKLSLSPNPAVILSGLALFLYSTACFSQNQNVTLVDAGQTLGLIPNATNDPGIPATIIQADGNLLPLQVISSPHSIVALDGSPIPGLDAANGPATEQIAIDTYQLRLLLATTDLEVTNGGPESTLRALRRYHSTVYQSKSGLRPGENPAKIFGTGWATSLLPHIHLQSPNPGLPPIAPAENPPDPDPQSAAYQQWLLDSVRHQILYDQWLDRQNRPHKATVTDELGVQYTFILDRAMQWVPVSSDTFGAQVQGTQLTIRGGGIYRLTKPSGVIIDYRLADQSLFVPDDRWTADTIAGVQASAPVVSGINHRWARAETAETGAQTVSWTYPNVASLLPSSISQSPGGETITITPSTLNPALVGSVSDGNGITVDYSYTETSHAARHSSDITVRELSSVTRTDTGSGDTTTVSYDLELTAEVSQSPPPPPKDPALWGQQENWENLTDPDLSPVEFYHWNLTSLTEGSDITSFTWEPDHSRTSYFDSPWWKGEYVITGQPMMLSEVIQDTGTTDLTLDSHESFSNVNNDLGLDTGGWREVTVSRTGGDTRSYTYDDIEYRRLDTSRNSGNTSIYSTPLAAAYGRLTISDPATDTPLLTVVPNNQSNLGQIDHHFSSLDSDGDGFTDGWENVIGSNRNDADDHPNTVDSYFADSDNDGTGNGIEITYYGTDPNNTADQPGNSTTTDPDSTVEPDSDGDGMPDAWEIRNGLNPADPSDATRDDDYDRLDNFTEYQLGTPPTVDWNFLAVTDAAALESLNERGQLLRVQHSDTTNEYKLEVWERGEWSERASLGNDTKETANEFVRHNNHGTAAAIFYETDQTTGQLSSLELRILHPDDSLTTHALNPSHSPVLHKVTDSGFIYIKTTAPDDSSQTVVWNPVTATLITHEDTELIDGNEPGQILATREVEQTVDGTTVTVSEGFLHDGTQWQALNGQAIALNNHSQALIAQETGATPASVEIRLWQDGTSVATGLSLQPGQEAQLNDSSQFIVHGSGGEAPVFVHSDGSQTTVNVSEDSNFTDPWVLITGLNDTGEVAGSFYDPDVTDPGTATFQAYSWHMGNYLFTGIYDDSSVHGITNSGFLSLGANEKVIEEQDFDGDGIPDQTNENWTTRLGILAPDNDVDKNGLPDDWETYHGVTDPAGDPDNDLLPNWAEYIHFTDPNKPDSDFDTIDDLTEVNRGTDPAWPNDGDLTSDLDNDGLSLILEIEYGTNPGVGDSDGDGLSDQYEVVNNLDPLDDDMDNDGVDDGTEVAQGTDPSRFDLGEDNFVPFAFDPNAPDADEDQIPDDFEIHFGLNPNDPSDANLDPDRDHLTNLQEASIGSNPVEAEGWVTTALEHGFVAANSRNQLLTTKIENGVYLLKLYTAGTWRDLGPLGNNTPQNLILSDSGDACGILVDQTGKRQIFRFSGGNISTFGEPSENLEIHGFLSDGSIVFSRTDFITTTERQSYLNQYGREETYSETHTSGFARQTEFSLVTPDGEISRIPTPNGQFTLNRYIGAVGTDFVVTGKTFDHGVTFSDVGSDPDEYYYEGQLAATYYWKNGEWEKVTADANTFFIASDVNSNGAIVGLEVVISGVQNGSSNSTQITSCTVAKVATTGVQRYGISPYYFTIDVDSDLDNDDAGGDVISQWLKINDDERISVVTSKYRSDSTSLETGQQYTLPLDVPGNFYLDEEFASSTDGALLSIDSETAVVIAAREYVDTTTEPDLTVAPIHPRGINRSGALILGDGILYPDPDSRNITGATKILDSGAIYSTSGFNYWKFPDLDSDGISDDWERFYELGPTHPDDAGHDLTVAPEIIDPDEDGLSNFDEFWLRTDPHDADFDDDGLIDGWEVKYGFSPHIADDATLDPDEDGVPNSIESAADTNPFKSNLDTDEDGMPDSWEVEYNLDITNAADALSDSDLDGLSNLVESHFGTNPLSRDSDGDGVIDSMELYADGTEPDNALSVEDYNISHTMNPDETATVTVSFTNTLGERLVVTALPSQPEPEDFNDDLHQWITPPTTAITVEDGEIATVNLELDSSGLYSGGEFTSEILLQDDEGGLVLQFDVTLKVDPAITTTIELIPGQEIRKGAPLSFTATPVVPQGIRLSEVEYYINGIYAGDTSSISSPVETSLFVRGEVGETFTVQAVAYDFFGRRGPLSNALTLEVALPEISADGDQLPDEWEFTWIIDRDAGDEIMAIEDVLESGDFDGDLMSNLDEYLAGTDPANPDSDGDHIFDGNERFLRFHIESNPETVELDTGRLVRLPDASGLNYDGVVTVEDSAPFWMPGAFSNGHGLIQMPPDTGFYVFNENSDVLPEMGDGFSLFGWFLPGQTAPAMVGRIARINADVELLVTSDNRIALQVNQGDSVQIVSSEQEIDFDSPWVFALIYDGETDELKLWLDDNAGSFTGSSEPHVTVENVDLLGAANELYFGGDSLDPGFAGATTEWLMLNTAVSPEQRQSLIQNLNLKYSIGDAKAEIRLASPENNVEFSAPAHIPLRIEVVHSDHPIAEVSYYSGDKLIGKSTNENFNFSGVWSLSTTSYHLVHARVLDTEGNEFRTDSHVIYVKADGSINVNFPGSGVSPAGGVFTATGSGIPLPDPDPDPGSGGGTGSGSYPGAGGFPGAGGNNGNGPGPNPDNGGDGDKIESDDTDGDGIPNWREIQMGLDPESKDTDGDTILDNVDWVPYDENLDQWEKTEVPQFMVIPTEEFIPVESNKFGMVLGYVKDSGDPDSSGPHSESPGDPENWPTYHIWYQGEWRSNKLGGGQNKTIARITLAQNYPIAYGYFETEETVQDCKGENQEEKVKKKLGWRWTPDGKYEELDEHGPEDMLYVIENIPDSVDENGVLTGSGVAAVCEEDEDESEAEAEEGEEAEEPLPILWENPFNPGCPRENSGEDSDDGEGEGEGEDSDEGDGESENDDPVEVDAVRVSWPGGWEDATDNGDDDEENDEEDPRPEDGAETEIEIPELALVIAYVFHADTACWRIIDIYDYDPDEEDCGDLPEKPKSKDGNPIDSEITLHGSVTQKMEGSVCEDPGFDEEWDEFVEGWENGNCAAPPKRHYMDEVDSSTVHHNGKEQPGYWGSTQPSMKKIIDGENVKELILDGGPALVGVSLINWKRGKPAGDGKCGYEEGEKTNVGEKLWITHDDKNELIDIVDGYKQDTYNDGNPLEVREFDENRQFRVGTGPNGEAGIDGLWANGYVHKWEELTGGYGITEWNEYDPNALSLAEGKSDGVEGDNEFPPYEGGMILIPLSIRQINENGSIGPVTGGGFSSSSPEIAINTCLLKNINGANGEAQADLEFDLTVTSEFLNTVKGDQGGIEEIGVFINGGEGDDAGDFRPNRVVDLNVSKEETPGDLRSPYPYEGTVQRTLYNIDLIDGVNTIEFKAIDPITGYIGSSLRSCTISIPSGTFVGQSYSLSLSAGQQLQAGAADTLTVSYADSNGVSIDNLTVTETDVDSKVFTDVDDTVTVTIHENTATSEPDEWNVRLQAAGVDIQVDVTETEDENFQFEAAGSSTGIQGDGSGGEPDPEPQPDPEPEDPSIEDQPADVNTTGSGDFFPMVMVLGVPEELGRGLDLKIESADGAEVPFRYHDESGSFILGDPENDQGFATITNIKKSDPAAANQGPSASVMLNQLRKLNLSGVPAEARFMLGLFTGVLGGGVDMVVGLYKLLEGAVKMVVRSRSVMVLRSVRLVFGSNQAIDAWTTEKINSLTEAQNAALAPLNAIGKLLADFFITNATSVFDIMLKLSTGKWEKAGISAAKFGAYHWQILEGAFEFIAGVWESYRKSPAEEQGYWIGVVVFEVASLFTPAAIGQVGKLSKLKVLTKLKTNLAPKLKSGGAMKHADDSISVVTTAKAGGWCFLAGTLIATPLGAVPIEEIRPGQIVCSAHEQTGEPGFNPVLELYRNKSSDIWTVTYDHDGDPETSGESFDCTGDHPVWCALNNEFVPARNLIPGRSLVRLIGGNTVRVEGIEKVRGPPGKEYTTYNFAVANHHTYFAGPGGVWVHNICPDAVKRFSALRRISYKSYRKSGLSRAEADQKSIMETMRWARKDYDEWVAAGKPGAESPDLVDETQLVELARYFFEEAAEKAPRIVASGLPQGFPIKQAEELAAFRRAMSRPDLVDDVKGAHNTFKEGTTVAKVETTPGEKGSYGISGGGNKAQVRRDMAELASTKPEIRLTQRGGLDDLAMNHAEASAIYNAWVANGKHLPNGFAIYVDRIMCGNCVGSSGLPKMLYAMGVDSIKVYSPKYPNGKILNVVPDPRRPPSSNSAGDFLFDDHSEIVQQ